jgi:hypothetical protein
MSVDDVQRGARSLGLDTRASQGQGFHPKQIYGIFCFCNAMRKRHQTIENAILVRVRGHGKGWVFTPRHFLDIAPRSAVASALKRHTDSGRVRQLARGLYDYPKFHPQLGKLTPAADAVAKALSGRDAARLQPSGAYAANLLGLSEQVPAKIVFLTDGASRLVRVGSMTIQLKRTTPRNMATAGRLSGLLIQAFRYLGKEHITAERRTHLKKTLPADERRTLIKDIKLAPAWMHPIMRELAGA